ncbi:MAG TPA: MgtC/SapB family protein [Urbifossiella sp.]|jgi:putative Mg2+ transporter-C (MgtC) family protein|nr:MgtC/SapB family protein [Urbifossiella sp.]
MPLTIDWPEILLRLGLAVLAGAALGLNRTARGMTVGLRTTLLVALAAAVSMIQVNLLLATAGKAPDAFPVLDLMRLPLGVLTGMGFIGAGAILSKGGRVRGVTTAATLWLATNLGLCFGGGQHGLGLAGLALGLAVLWSLKRVEARIPHDRRGSLALAVAEGGPADEEIRAILTAAGARAKAWSVAYSGRGRATRRKIVCEVHWPGRPGDPPAPEFVRNLVGRPGIRAVRWRGQ